jgi:predicted DNA-binding transcriptional regulator AlpA
MTIILTTPEQLEILIQRSISKVLNINLTSSELPDRCTFKEALEITGLSKSALYKRTMDKTIPFKSFGNRLIFSRRELIEWVETNTIAKPKKNPAIKIAYLSKSEVDQVISKNKNIS